MRARQPAARRVARARRAARGGDRGVEGDRAAGPGLPRARRRRHGRELQGARAARARASRCCAGCSTAIPGSTCSTSSTRSTAEQEGDEAAWRLVRDEVRRNPTLVGLDRLIDAELVRAPPERRQDLQLMKDLVHSHAQALACTSAPTAASRRASSSGNARRAAAGRRSRRAAPPSSTARDATSRGCNLDNRCVIVPLDFPTPRRARGRRAPGSRSSAA